VIRCLIFWCKAHPCRKKKQWLAVILFKCRLAISFMLRNLHCKMAMMTHRAFCEVISTAHLSGRQKCDDCENYKTGHRTETWIATVAIIVCFLKQKKKTRNHASACASLVQIGSETGTVSNNNSHFLRDKLSCLCNMSSFSPATYISELDDRFRYDRRLDTLQETDIVALDLVRRALSTRDLFAVILVRNRHCALFKHRRVLTRYRKPRSTIQWFHLLWFPRRLTYIRWRMAWIWFATFLKFQR